MESKNGYVRHVAVKVPLSYIVNGMYEPATTESLACLITPDGSRIYRVNVMATILNKEIQGNITNLYLDDSTGNVVVRSFEEHPLLQSLRVGEVLLVVGKVRVYNQEKYLSPEIIKKVLPSWLAVRLEELKPMLSLAFPKYPVIETARATSSTTAPDQNGGNIVVEDVFDTVPSLPTEKIIKLVRELDLGAGALIEEVIEKSPLPGTEQLLETMLQNGSIFQVVPGRVKVL